MFSQIDDSILVHIFMIATESSPDLGPSPCTGDPPQVGVEGHQGVDYNWLGHYLVDVGALVGI